MLCQIVLYYVSDDVKWPIWSNCHWMKIRTVLLSGGFYLHFKFTVAKMSFHNSQWIYQLFGLFNEHRRLNLRRLLRRGFVGFSSQMNGVRFRQSNIFHDFDAVNATQPKRFSSLKTIVSWNIIFVCIWNMNCLLVPRIFWCPGSKAIALQWYIEWINEITFALCLFQSNESMPYVNFQRQIDALV